MLKLARRARGHFVTLIEIRVHLIRVKPGHISKVRDDIDRLPLNSEGYERAKSILKGEYGKTSEIINAYVRNTLELPVVTSSDPKRVNAFYKTLLYNVQSLETLGKLERVNGMARSVLDKLKGIKADLGRGIRIRGVMVKWYVWHFLKKQG